jgi:hypothetical protein
MPMATNPDGSGSAVVTAISLWGNLWHEETKSVGERVTRLRPAKTWPATLGSRKDAASTILDHRSGDR